MPRGLGAAPPGRQDSDLNVFPGLGSKRKPPRADKYADVVVEEGDDDEEDNDEDNDDSGFTAAGPSSSMLGGFGRGGIGGKRKRSSKLAMRTRGRDDDDDEFMHPSTDSSDEDEKDDDDAADDDEVGDAATSSRKRAEPIEEDDLEFVPKSFTSRATRGGLGSSSHSAARREEDGEGLSSSSKRQPARRRGIGASVFVKAKQPETVVEVDDVPEPSPPQPGPPPPPPPTLSSTNGDVPGSPPGPPPPGRSAPGLPPSIPASINPYASASSMQESNMPSAFGSQSSFKKRAKAIPEERGRPTPPPLAASLPTFATGTSKFNPAAMLASLGWSGAGLGKDGEGMVKPIDVQLRPVKAGLAFGGRTEMTKQTKAEEKRRGHREGSGSGSEEDEEESSGGEGRRAGRRKKADKKGKGKGKGKEKEGGQARVEERSWTKREKKPRKPRVEHRSYEELIEEAGGMPETDPGVGKVYDAMGREHASLAAALAHHAVPTQAESSTHLPELRHNLRLICDSNRRNLDVLARQGADILERRRWVRRERDEAERKVAAQRVQAQSLRNVLEIVNELEKIGSATQRSSRERLSKGTVAAGLGNMSLDGKGEGESELDQFDPVISRMISQHGDDVQKYGLDEALVGAIAPTIKNVLRHWDPFTQPSRLLVHFSRWQDVMLQDRLPSDRRTAGKDDTMRPFETLLWQLWMPPVRSALNNRWDPSLDPTLPLPLIEMWKPLLPSFIMENLVTQLLLPKLSRAVSDWNPAWRRRSGHQAAVELHQIVFPWLPLLSDRLDDIMADAKRRVKSMLKSWKVTVPMPAQLEEWKEIIEVNEWDSMLLVNIVPKLSARLRDEFEVNPGEQDVGPLEDVLAWRRVLRKSVLSRMLEMEFFTKWLRLLHMWLTQPSIDFEEVAQWFAYWKSWFPEDIAELPGIIHGFQKGMSLIEDAAALGDDRDNLPMPDLSPLSRAAFTAAQDALDRQHNHHHPALKANQPTGANREVTFRGIVEEAAASADLFVMPLNRSHAQTGHALYRLSNSVDSKAGAGGKGAVFYIDDEVCFAEVVHPAEGGGVEFEPVSIEELIEMARAGGAR
ncbi:hypothetical protein A4X13_0g3111 [Tilletia indica]|uniref:Uncharacterized protein n=1 Tax=Tilletia indica TaxID=43049 RepID=A0A177TQ31_9BASI|nr:hypothetical protein A4X13_0g3111 [Tilletia indica]